MGEKKKFYHRQVRRSLLKMWFRLFPLRLYLVFFYLQMLYALLILWLSKLWGEERSEENKKLCWKSWNDLCKPKNLGRMGFQDFKVFNLSLLAKRCWRVILSPSYVVVNCLLGSHHHISIAFPLALALISGFLP